MKRILLASAALLLLALPAQGQRFRSGIFLHHSTGGCIWGPNGSATSVPQEIDAYNAAHGFSGDNAASLDETWWPSNDNEWNTWHNVFENNDPSNDITPILDADTIVMIKSCFPSSEMDTCQGSPDDTLSPDWKTIYNYKWHWRHIVNAMGSRTDRFFVIWTNAPLTYGSYGGDSASRCARAAMSDRFCHWAKDTLAAGLEGSFPGNIYVFDFFHKLADGQGFIPWPQYAQGAGDSHPNDAATALVAPQLVQEIFDAALAYETPQAVGLADWTAVCNLHDVGLRWATESEPAGLRFTVQRRNAGADWLALADIAGQGSANQHRDYSFTDHDPSAGQNDYRLRMDGDRGGVRYSPTASVIVGGPDRSMSPASPNPFRTATAVRFQSSGSGIAELSIYNISGQRVAGRQVSCRTGNNRIGWDGRDDAGKRLQPGIYFYRISAPGHAERGKMTLVR